MAFEPSIRHFAAAEHTRTKPIIASHRSHRATPDKMTKYKPNNSLSMRKKNYEIIPIVESEIVPDMSLELIKGGGYNHLCSKGY